MKDVSYNKIVNSVKLIKNNKSADINTIILDTQHGIDITYLLSLLDASKVKTVLVPVTNEYVRRAVRTETTYLDMYKAFPLLKIEGNKYHDFSNDIIKLVDTNVLNNYECFVFDQVTGMDTKLREWIIEYFRLFHPNKVLLMIYDSGAFVGYNDRISHNLDLRAHYILPKSGDRNPDFGSGNTFLALRYRSSRYQKLEPIEHNNDYEIRAVNGRDFLRKLSFEEIMNTKLKFNKQNNGIPQLVCGNNMLGHITKLLRQQMGYTNNVPMEGESLIAYNDFQTLNPNMQNIVIRKGSVFKLKKRLKPNMFIIEYNGNEHYILVDLNVFVNILDYDALDTNRLLLDEHTAHVFYHYAITSEMFEHTSFDNVVAYINGRVLSSYMYSLVKIARKTITIFVDTSVINQELL